MREVHTETPSCQLERPEHNSRVWLIVVPEFPPGDSRYGKTDFVGHPGTYRVTFVLSVPGKNVFRENVALGRTLSEGDSLLLLPANSDTIEVRLETDGSLVGSVTLKGNPQGRLANAVLKVDANSIAEAEIVAYNTTASVLSYCGFVSDVPIDIAGYEVLEESTGTVKGVYGLVGRVKQFSTLGRSTSLVSDTDYKRLFAAYREGMNSTNVFYQALSFSKAIEGCHKMRTAKKTRAKASGAQPFTPPLEMPSQLEEIPLLDEDLRECFRPFLGWKLNAVVDHFKPLIRNAIAHLDPSRDVLDIDRFEDIAASDKAIPILRYMARRFIVAELDNP